MATALYMKLDGVDGECVVEGYEGWMDLLSVSFAGTQSGTMQTGRGGGSGKIEMQDLTFLRVTDKCTPILMRMLCQGQHFATVDIHATKATGDKPMPYFTIKLDHAIMTYLDLGEMGERDQMVETGSLNFRQITVEYRIQNEDGTEIGATSASYNVATGASG